MEAPPLPSPLQRIDLRRRLPSLGEQLDLVEATYRAMARGAVELPTKIGVHSTLRSRVRCSLGPELEH
jgi:hypothetical protein